MQTGYLKQHEWHPTRWSALPTKDGATLNRPAERTADFMIILYLFVLVVVLAIFMLLGGRSRRRKRQSAEPVINITNEPHVGRAPGED